ncbi:MAG: glutamate 5-kinase [Nitrospirae bacterium GWC2_56_14]|nr:MAG: glutamate 5-kinase [Nitrospirae bacterium GWC2_56_14]
MKNASADKKSILSKARRVVIKVGSAVLTSSGGGLDQKRIEQLAKEIVSIMDGRREVVLVSSGAIAAGLAKLGLKKTKGMPLPLKQAAAAVGQSGLMWMYEKTFGAHGKKVAQVLLTREDLSNRSRFLNARNTLHTLLEYDVIPIINENDTVAVDEIKFGDNDNLSGMVVQLTDADLLIILSDIDGLYTADPRLHPDARFIPVVEKITAEMERGAGDALSGVGTGGMRSKIMTAKKVGAYGVPMVILNGKKTGLLAALFGGSESGTLFLPRLEKMDSRKHWIAYTAASKGGIVVDDGGRDALVHKGKSLLPGGVVSVEGTFKVGDCVNCLDLRGSVFARGLTKYSSGELELIKGLKTSQIEPVLGHKDYDEVIHRDDLVIL